MHAQASSSSNLVSESSSDDEEYLQQVPMEKMRIVKNYKRVKSQLRALKRKKKMILVEEKVIKEEKMLLKNLLFKTLDTKSDRRLKGRQIASTNLASSRSASFSSVDDTLLIQIQKEELTRTSSLEILNQIDLKTRVPNISSLPDKYRNDKDMINKDKNIIQHDGIHLAQDNFDKVPDNMYNIPDDSDNHTQQPNITNAQDGQNTDKPQQSKKIIRTQKPQGYIIHKMIDENNSYYIKISRPVRSKPKYHLIIKKLFRSLKPVMKEFSDFICLELFMHVVRQILEERITELLADKEKLKTKRVLELYREKYPYERDGYFIISTLVAIWRGDYNDPAEPDDPYDELIRQRDPEKLVSYEDIACGTGVWETECNDEAENVDSAGSICSKTDLINPGTEADGMSNICDMDSSFEIVDKDEVKGNIDDNAEIDKQHEVKSDPVGNNKEDTFPSNEFKRLPSDGTETTNKAIEKLNLVTQGRVDPNIVTQSEDTPTLVTQSEVTPTLVTQSGFRSENKTLIDLPLYSNVESMDQN